MGDLDSNGMQSHNLFLWLPTWIMFPKCANNECTLNSSYWCLKQCDSPVISYVSIIDIYIRLFNGQNTLTEHISFIKQPTWMIHTKIMGTELYRMFIGGGLL